MLKAVICLALAALVGADVSSLPYVYNRPGVQLSSRPSPQIVPAPRRPYQGPAPAQSFPAPVYQGPSQGSYARPDISYSRPAFSVSAPSRNYLSPTPTYSVPPPPPPVYSPASSYNSPSVSYPAPRPIPSYSAPVASYPVPAPSYSAPIINHSPPIPSYAAAPSISYSIPTQSLSVPTYNPTAFRPTKSSRDQTIYDYTDDILDNETRNSIQEILAKEERRAVQLDNNFSIYMDDPIRAVDIAQFSVPQRQYSSGFVPSAPIPAPVYGPPRY